MQYCILPKVYVVYIHVGPKLYTQGLAKQTKRESWLISCSITSKFLTSIAYIEMCRLVLERELGTLKIAIRGV